MTQRRRHAPYNYDQGTRAATPEPSEQRVPTEEVRRKWDMRIHLEEQAKARRTELRGSDQSVLLATALEGPFNNPADASLTKTVLTFTVPLGRVLVVDSYSWKLSDPFLQSSIGIYDVNLYVDDSLVPFWQDTREGTPIATMPNIIDISPIYVQSNSTLSILLRRIDPTFVEFIAITVFVRGWFEKPVGGV